MANASIIGNFKGFGDFEQEAQKQGLAQALMQAQILKASNPYKGENLPAPLQLANEYQKRVTAGDINGANLIMQFAKTQDKGLQVDANGSFAPLAGYAGAVASIEGAKSGAKQDAQNISDSNYKPGIAGKEAESKFTQELKFATPITEAKKVGDAMGESKGAIVKKSINAPATLSVLDQIEALDNKGMSLLDKASGSTLGALGAAGNQFIGRSTDATKANAELAVLGNTLVNSIPRMEGPQSDADVRFYKEQAGRIADPKVPEGDKRAALKSIRQLQNKYASQQTNSLDDVLRNYQQNIPATPAEAKSQFNASKQPKPRLKYNPATGDFE
jgi:hypothetical protein